MMGCNHCLHPMWCGIRCGVCGRWADEKNEPSEALKQAWENYKQALKEYGPTDGMHTCHDQCQRPACVQTRKAVEAEREACAKVCENVKLKGREVFADAIRARKSNGNVR